jgi:hypothetical protein
MASDTAPAAVPGPENTPQSTAPTASPQAGTQQPGGIAGLLAAVEPTRSSDFTLTPTTDHATGQQQVTGSSAEFQNGDPAGNPEGKQNSGGSGGTGRPQTSVVRAWLLAGAERWKKGADARNKRLDIQKARAQALQVKETRTVSVNRSGGILNGKGSGGSAGNSGNSGKASAGKSLTSKSNGGAPNGPKNAPRPKQDSPKSGASGSGHTAGKTPRSGGGTGPKPGKGLADGSGSGSGRGGQNGDGKNRSDQRSPKVGPQGTKDKSAGHSTSVGSNSGNAPNGKDGKKTSPGKTQTTTTCGDGSGISTAKDKPPKQNPGKTGSDRAGAPGRQDKPANNGRPDQAGKQDGPVTPGKTDPAAPKPKPKTAGEPGGSAGPKNTDPKDPNAPKDPKSGNGSADPKKPTTPATRRIDLQASREAGYRDGTRAAKATAHVEAWRDGARDGYRDTKEAAAREKQRLDNAHHEHKTAPTRPDKDQPVTQPASSADYQQTVPPKPDHAPGPQPIPVTDVDATHVHLGGAARPSMKHGEVRTLRRFQQVLNDKTDRMTKVAEATRALEHHAQEQAKEITQLLEQARAVEGGEKLVADLTRLAETADVQTGKAAEIHKRGVRAADACKTLNTNTETRYGGIYRAVVDSGETAPAKMSYYQEMTHA